MPTNRREVILDRRRRVAKLHLEHKSLRTIATLVGVSLGQAHADVKAVELAWRKEMVADMDTAKQRELRELAAVAAEAWDAWERSQQPRETSLQEMVQGEAGDDGTASQRSKVTLKKEGQVGDPRFLERIQRAIDQRCEILGLKGPLKVAPTTPDGTQPYTVTARERDLTALAMLLALPAEHVREALGLPMPGETVVEDNAAPDVP